MGIVYESNRASNLNAKINESLTLDTLYSQNYSGINITNTTPTTITPCTFSSDNLTLFRRYYFILIYFTSNSFTIAGSGSYSSNVNFELSFVFSIDSSAVEWKHTYIDTNAKSYSSRTIGAVKASLLVVRDALQDNINSGPTASNNFYEINNDSTYNSLTLGSYFYFTNNHYLVTSTAISGNITVKGLLKIV